jgi:hypothetical protein
VSLRTLFATLFRQKIGFVTGELNRTNPAININTTIKILIYLSSDFSKNKIGITELK